MATTKLSRIHDKRGNAADRKARKVWMLRTYGDGTTAPCVYCDRAVSYETMEVDRIVCGGSYRRDNVQVTCVPCNKTRSDRKSWVSPKGWWIFSTGAMVSGEIALAA